MSKLKVRSRTYISLPITLCLMAGFILFFAAYFGMVSSTGISQFNEPILVWMSTHRDPIISTMMQYITSLASPTAFIIFVSIIAIVWVYRKKETWQPLLMVAAVGLSALASSLLKTVTHNARPDNIDMVPPFETGYSFPSGHTLSTIVFLLVTGYLLYSRYHNDDKRFWLIIWLIISISGTALIALSRLYLGYHWLTDIIGSIGLGAMIFALIIIVDKHTTNNRKSE